MMSCLIALLVLPAPPVRHKPVLAHVMPWFASQSISGAWGWHWTMGKRDPGKLVGGQPDIAAHQHPLIGAYDSGDPDTVSCQLLLMKLAGIDGILIDWYSEAPFVDWGTIHRNTLLLMDVADRLGLKYGLVYEDQVLKTAIEAKNTALGDPNARATATLQYLKSSIFLRKNSFRLGGLPVLLTFGPQFLTSDKWEELGAGKDFALFTLHNRIKGAQGAFDWPLPKGGSLGCESERKRFHLRSTKSSAFVDAVYPRFQDYYAQAGVQPSWGNVPDDGGRRFARLLKEGLADASSFVQLVTWNDWGEGTEIEPSIEYGYRDLETTRKMLAPDAKSWSLRLPVKIYQLRKKFAIHSAKRAKLDEAEQNLINGDAAKCNAILAQM